MIFGIYGALVAYLIGEGRSLAVLFGLQDTVLFSFWGFGLGGELLMSLLFFFVASMIVYFGLNVVKISELFMSVFIGIIILALCAVGFFSVDFGALGAFDFSRVLIPYGVVLFALAGAVAIPEMKEQLRDKKLLKKAIIIGALIPIVLYVLFSLVVVGVCENVSEVATICLGDYIGFAFVFGNLFAVLAMFTSFLTLGLGLRWAYNFDYKISKVVSCVLATLVPLVIFLLILFFGMEESFFRTIGLTGGVAMTIEGILIVLMFGRAKKMGDRKPEYSLDRSSLVSMLLVLVFLFVFV